MLMSDKNKTEKRSVFYAVVKFNLNKMALTNVLIESPENIHYSYNLYELRFNHNYFDYLLNVSTAIGSLHQEFWDG